MIESTAVYAAFAIIVILCAWMIGAELAPRIARDRRRAKRMRALDRSHKQALARQKARFDALMLELRR